MRLRRWHRLGIVLTLLGGIGVFYYVFTRDDELSAEIYSRQMNECRVAERRGLPVDKCYRSVEQERARVLRDKTLQAAIVTSGVIAAAWLVGFVADRVYRWTVPAPKRRRRKPRKPPRKRIEPRL